MFCGEERMIQPAPAVKLDALHAASERTILVPVGAIISGFLLLEVSGFSGLLCKLHSRAILIAVDSVSSGEAENPSNTNRLRAFHNDHMTHGTTDPLTIPAGGRLFWLHIEG